MKKLVETNKRNAKKTTVKRVHPVDNPEDVQMQKSIKSRANYSLALLGMAFVENGSGRFLNLRSD